MNNLLLFFYFSQAPKPRVRKSRWTETAEVKVGQVVSGPKLGPAPVPREKEDGTKLTKAQRKKLKKKRRKEEKKKGTDSGIDTGNDSGFLLYTCYYIASSFGKKYLSIV